MKKKFVYAVYASVSRDDRSSLISIFSTLGAAKTAAKRLCEDMRIEPNKRLKLTKEWSWQEHRTIAVGGGVYESSSVRIHELELDKAVGAGDE